MGRPPGTRNAGFDATRAELLAAARARLGEPDGARASFRELAAAAGVSVATLRHYFGSRQGLLEALLAHAHTEGAPYLLQVAAGPLGPLRESVRWLLGAVAEGFARGGLEKLHTIGLATGLGAPAIGPAYVREVLEPTLQCVEARLVRHVAAGELRPCDARVAAIALVGPLLVALLHQGPLGGRACRPLDMGAFIEEHAAQFERAYGVSAPATPPPATTHRAHPSRRVR